MENYNQTDIKEALKNIKELKVLLNNKQKILKPVVLSKEFVQTVLFASLLLIVTTIITAIAYSTYDSFWDFSLFYKIIIIASLIINLMILSIRKTSAFYKRNQINIKEIFADIYTPNILILVFLSFLFCFIFQMVTSINWIYLPFLTITYGLMVISMATPVGMSEFKVMGYLTIIFGIISLLFIQTPILLLTLCIYSLIFFSYFIILSFARRAHN